MRLAVRGSNREKGDRRGGGGRGALRGLDSDRNLGGGGLEELTCAVEAEARIDKVSKATSAEAESSKVREGQDHN